MSPRKPTIDDVDDVDDEDGVLNDEEQEETDLSLDVRDEDEVGLGGAPPREDDGSSDDEAEDDLAEDDLAEDQENAG